MGKKPYGRDCVNNPVDDLVFRERINLSLSKETTELLRKVSAETGTPISRLVDRAVMAMYEKKSSE